MKPHMSTATTAGTAYGRKIDDPEEARAVQPRAVDGERGDQGEDRA